MFATFRWWQSLIFPLGRERLPQRDEVLQRAIVIDFDGDPLESLVAAMRAKTLLLVKRQLEASVASACMVHSVVGVQD